MNHHVCICFSYFRFKQNKQKHFGLTQQAENTVFCTGNSHDHIERIFVYSKKIVKEKVLQRTS